ncbi:uncharacterized protein K452DRAFT_309872 [Aplosporella prunicola CBS 121167]|uniref:Uncharacterized protein n=1 Tax=Aplosporella prunicola CBS 121167 TaxID=1176127 RepID=A0A6A6B9R7_9PEZI|nr:uncharacterized protein K452DRAFT_309872 [Aplosporella prunicola CBS 121167]KAF2140776.1 hypothetical protein K452DRAFT_309872 [Aplosporella prunicola CBS 121167]
MGDEDGKTHAHARTDELFHQVLGVQGVRRSNGTLRQGDDVLSDAHRGCATGTALTNWRPLKEDDELGTEDGKDDGEGDEREEYEDGGKAGIKRESLHAGVLPALFFTRAYTAGSSFAVKASTYLMFIRVHCEWRWALSRSNAPIVLSQLTLSMLIKALFAPLLLPFPLHPRRTQRTLTKVSFTGTRSAASLTRQENMTAATKAKLWACIDSLDDKKLEGGNYMRGSRKSSTVDSSEMDYHLDREHTITRAVDDGEFKAGVTYYQVSLQAKKGRTGKGSKRSKATDKKGHSNAKDIRSSGTGSTYATIFVSSALENKPPPAAMVKAALKSSCADVDEKEMKNGILQVPVHNCVIQGDRTWKNAHTGVGGKEADYA